MSPNQIAKVCHETNRAYCQATGDFSQPVWELAPEWQKQSVMGIRVGIHAVANSRGQVPKVRVG